jgi:hypothetical protein
VNPANGVEQASELADLKALSNLPPQQAHAKTRPAALDQTKSIAQASLDDWLSRSRAEIVGLRGFRVELVGLNLP